MPLDIGKIILTAIIASLFVLSGCGGGSLSLTLRCPAILPAIECGWTAQCPETFEAELRDAVPVEELKASKLESDADSLSCREALDACVRRDRIIYNEWSQCD